MEHQVKADTTDHKLPSYSNEIIKDSKAALNTISKPKIDSKLIFECGLQNKALPTAQNGSNNQRK